MFPAQIALNQPSASPETSQQPPVSKNFSFLVFV